MLDRKICFIGFGNTIRSDDGLGPYIIARLEQKLGRYGNFAFITLRQPDPALAPVLAGYDEVIFIDASVNADEEVIFERVEPAKTDTFSTHVATPEQLLHLSSLYGKAPVCRLLQVRGYEFGFGESPSEKGKEAAARAVDAILAYIGT